MCVRRRWSRTDEDGTYIFAFGKPGRGKSATVKAFVLRMMDFGYRTLIVADPRDEYERLCRALGVEPFAIGHGLSTGSNPLAVGPLGAGWEDLNATDQRYYRGSTARNLACGSFS